jgi:hypothetical protein
MRVSWVNTHFHCPPCFTKMSVDRSDSLNACPLNLPFDVARAVMTAVSPYTRTLVSAKSITSCVRSPDMINPKKIDPSSTLPSGVMMVQSWATWRPMAYCIAPDERLCPLLFQCHRFLLAFVAHAPPPFRICTFGCHQRLQLAHSTSRQAMAKEPTELRGLARGGSQGHGQGHRRVPQELTEEIQG